MWLCILHWEDIFVLYFKLLICLKEPARSTIFYVGMSHCLCVCSLDDVHQVEWAWLDPGGHGEHQAQRWYVRSQSVIVFILAFIILHFDNVICLVLNYYIEVSVNAFSDTEHMYFPNVFFFQFGTFSWCIITMFSTVLMHSVCVCVSSFCALFCTSYLTSSSYFTFSSPLPIAWLLMLWKANCYHPCVPSYP